MENRGHGVVIYDSKFGNTERIARSLAGGLRMAGVETACVNTNDVHTESLRDYDLIAIGAPTQMFTASKPMKDFLVKLTELEELQGKFAFAFDTKLPSRLSGSASKYIEKKLRDLGMTIIAPRRSAIVDKTEGPLEGGEVESFERLGYDIGTSLARDVRNVLPHLAS